MIREIAPTRRRSSRVGWFARRPSSLGTVPKRNYHGFIALSAMAGVGWLALRQLGEVTQRSRSERGIGCWWVTAEVPKLLC